MTIQKIRDALKVAGTDKLRDIIIKSDKEKREYGLSFCDNGHITTTDTCIGDDCSMQMTGCGHKKTIGSFHTHVKRYPKDIDYPNISRRDIEYSITHNDSFSCIGLIQDKEPTIKCYISYYGVNKNVVSNEHKTRDDFNKKIVEYNPSGTDKGIESLPHEKRIELEQLYGNYIIAKKKLEEASEKAFWKLSGSPNQGADFTMKL